MVSSPTQEAHSLSTFHWIFSEEMPAESIPQFFPRVLDCQCYLPGRVCLTPSFLTDVYSSTLLTNAALQSSNQATSRLTVLHSNRGHGTGVIRPTRSIPVRSTTRTALPATIPIHLSGRPDPHRSPFPALSGPPDPHRSPFPDPPGNFRKPLTCPSRAKVSRDTPSHLAKMINGHESTLDYQTLNQTVTSTVSSLTYRQPEHLPLRRRIRYTHQSPRAAPATRALITSWRFKD
jgi:hypothetical protein